MTVAPFIGISRLRMKVDGCGITTLVAFHGCPLRCHYCFNAQCFHAEGIRYRLTAEEVMKQLRKDELYFMATGGGVCFGGGEPLLHAKFICEVLGLGADKWHTTIESSFNVPRSQWEQLVPFAHEYIVDIKDMQPNTYRAYTGKDNSLVLDNLRWLAAQGKADSVICRIPLIPDFNDKEAQQRSMDTLRDMGFSRFDVFTYKKDIKKAI